MLKVKNGKREANMVDYFMKSILQSKYDFYQNWWGKLWSGNNCDLENEGFWKMAKILADGFWFMVEGRVKFSSWDILLCYFLHNIQEGGV